MTACSLLEGGKIREAFGTLKGWYRDVGPRPPLPSREEIETTRVEYETLFNEEEPHSPPFPIHTTPFAISDNPPTEEEVVEALSKLRTNRAAGATGITAEMVKQWQMEATLTNDDGDPVSPRAVTLWNKVLELVRLAFEDGIIPKAFCHGIL